MKFPLVCILWYGHTFLYTTQNIDTYCGIALLYWEYIFTSGDDLYSIQKYSEYLYSNFTTKESTWLFTVGFLWLCSKFPEKRVHSVYLFWLNLSNKTSFRLLLINTATHAAIQIFTPRAKYSEWNLHKAKKISTIYKVNQGLRIKQFFTRISSMRNH